MRSAAGGDRAGALQGWQLGRGVHIGWQLGRGARSACCSPSSSSVPPVVLQLETEIAALRAQNRMYQRVLAVRDAMLQTFTSLQPPEAQAAALQQPSGAAPTSAEQQGPAVPAPQLPAPETAGGLVQALNELPSEGELEAAAQSAEVAGTHAQQVAGQEPLAGSNEGAAASGSSASGLEGSSGAEACAAVGPAPQSLLGEAHRSGTAHSLDGSALQEVEEVPAASNKALLARIEAWAGPEDLVRGRERGTREGAREEVAAAASTMALAPVPHAPWPTVMPHAA